MLQMSKKVTLEGSYWWATADGGR